MKKEKTKKLGRTGTKLWPQKYWRKDQRSCDGRGGIYFWGSTKKQRGCDGWGGAQRPVRSGLKPKKTGAHARQKPTSLSYIYLGSSVCLSSCHIPSCRPVIFLSSCHICGTLSYSLRFSNQTDQGDETEGLEREGLRWRDRKGTDCRGRVWIDFSLIKPY